MKSITDRFDSKMYSFFNSSMFPAVMFCHFDRVFGIKFRILLWGEGNEKNCFEDMFDMIHHITLIRPATKPTKNTTKSFFIPFQNFVTHWSYVFCINPMLDVVIISQQSSFFCIRKCIVFCIFIVLYHNQ